MRHLIHTIKFHPSAPTRSATGSWTNSLDEDAVAIDAWVGAPRTEEATGSEAQVSCVAVLPVSVEVDSAALVEVVSHPVHSGLYRIASVSGGRHLRRLALARSTLADGTDAV